MNSKIFYNFLRAGHPKREGLGRCEYRKPYSTEQKRLRFG